MKILRTLISTFAFFSFLSLTPMTVFADDCAVDCKGEKKEIDCPGKGCGCWCNEDNKAVCKCGEPKNSNAPADNNKK
ncbi:hypothetical protein OQJ13_11755 [Legionella sp. PATHC035]|uniref:hypothetical protein n=1 Tax=Legionella sp. PATHC035 TaxID=2992040 RepID=UPI0022433FC9|nr:hypothetical protein [Legionella sp. PATHC035]MCW8409646.1 hypothetical protein [Legionella sp. PATHC035]